MESKAETTVTFHGGTLTIGGTVTEVAYKDAHIFFDFGTESRPESNLPDGHIETLINNRLVPELEDLYDPRLGYEYHSAEDKDYQHATVLLSHTHLDYSRMTNYLSPAAPPYTLKETKIILNSSNRKGDFLIPSPFEEKSFIREMVSLNKNDVIKVGGISVEIVSIDHDAYGASALLIRTSDHFITYIGDLRLRGHNHGETLTFRKKAKHTELLMMEGVSISFPRRESDPAQIAAVSEEDLVQHLVCLELKDPNRQITFNGYPTNMERFAKITEKSSRTVVLEANMAALLLEVFGIKVRYYYTESGKMPGLNPALEIPYDTLLKDKADYLWQIVNQFDSLQEGSLYTHSDAQSLGGFGPRYRVFLDLLAKEDITFVRLACPGHAIPEDLNEIIALIEP